MNWVRRVAAFLLLAALLGVLSPVSAQETGGEGTVEPESSIYVGVSCAFDETTGTSICDFTPVDPAGGVPLGLTIPAENLCAPVIPTGEEGSPEGALSVTFAEGAGSASFIFDGEVSVGGAATYEVATDAGSISAPGDGLLCGAAGSSDGDTIIGDMPEDVPVDDPIDEGQIDGGGTGEGEIGEGETGEGEIGEVPPADETGATGEEESLADEVVVPDVTVSVIVYDCTIDPGVADPATLPECTPSAGVELSATADDVDEGTATTDATGAAWFDVPEGSLLVVSEDTSTIPTGFEPYGNGVAMLTAETGSTIVFIHLAEPIVGRLQIINGSCPTSGESRTEFRVIEPRSVAMAEAPECGVRGGTVFTLLGGTLGEEGLTILIGDNGTWRGFLPPGDYTIVDDLGSSADVTILVNDISIVLVIDYVSHPLGVLNVSRFVCSGADEAAIELTLFGTEPVVGDGDGCEPSGGSVTIDVESEVSSASIATLDLSGDGVEEIELEPGNYRLTDDASGQSMTFSIDGGSRLFAVIRDLVVGGDDIGNPDGGNPGGGDPGGDDPDGGNPAPDTGGTPNDGTGNPGAPDPDEGDNGTDGGVDAGETGHDEVDEVTQLPATGMSDGNGAGLTTLLALLVASGGLGAGAVALRRGRRAA